MPEYNDEEYLKYSSMLSSAIYGLVDNTISREDIMEMVDNALADAELDADDA
jgi:hypothetical protein